MEYSGPPRDGADRSSRVQDGLLANGFCARRGEGVKLVEELNKGQIDLDTSKDVEVVCAPPLPYLVEVKSNLRKDSASNIRGASGKGG